MIRFSQPALIVQYADMPRPTREQIIGFLLPALIYRQTRANVR